MVVVQAIGIDPGIRNLGVARATFEISTDDALPRCTRIESSRVDLLSECAWARGAKLHAAIESSRTKTMIALLESHARRGTQVDGGSTPPPCTTQVRGIKRGRRKRGFRTPRAWRPWRAKPPRTARLATSREIVQVASCASKHIVPACTVPTVVYIEAQPAGRASNAKIGAIALSLFTSIRSRIANGGEPLLACELIPPARKYSSREVYEPLQIHGSDSGSGARAAAAVPMGSRSGGYSFRKAESCRIAEVLLSRVVRPKDGAEPSPSSVSSMTSLNAPVNERSRAKVDDEADAMILAYLAARDLSSHIAAYNKILKEL